MANLQPWTHDEGKAGFQEFGHLKQVKLVSDANFMNTLNLYSKTTQGRANKAHESEQQESAGCRHVRRSVSEQGQ